MNKTTIRQLTASTLLWLAACVVVGLASNAAYAQGTPNKLESIDVQNVAGQQVQLTLRHSSPPSEPVAFTIDNPPASRSTSRTPHSRCLRAASTFAPAEWIPCSPPKPLAARASC